MKKFLALLLVIFMLIPFLSACDNTPDGNDKNNNNDDATKNDTNNEDVVTDPQTILAGYGRADWTPNFEVMLLGDASARTTSKVYSKVYASCTAFRDEAGNTALIYTVDLHSIYTGIVKTLKKAINEATGVPENNIILSATHSHFTPNPNQPDKLPKIYKLLEDACVKAAEDAIADLAECKIYTSSVTTQGLSFSRRFVDRNENGRYEPQTGGEYEADINRDLLVIKLEREGDKKDIVLANFAAHATITGVDQISADYIGACRESFEKSNPDTYFSLYIGASGELIAKEWVETTGAGIRGDGLTWDPDFVGIEKYGKILASCVKSALDKSTLVESERGVEVLNRACSVEVDHTQDSLSTKAATIIAANSSGDAARTELLCEKYGIKNVYEATAITQRAARDKTDDLPLTAITVGELAFASAPYEMFSSNATAVKEGSPYKQTFMLTCSNGHFCYIPNDLAFETGGYEVYSCYYVRGAGEMLQNEFVNMLNELYK